MDREQVLKQYATWQRSCDWSESTIHARVTFVRARMKEWGGLSGFDEATVRTYFSELVERQREKSNRRLWTLPTYHSHLSDFCAWAKAAGHLESNPMLAIPKPKRPKSRPQPLSDSEVAAVFAAAPETVRDWMSLALFAGLRVSEIARLRGQDVRADGLHILGKGGSVEVLPCRAEIRAMAVRYPSSGFWFPGSEHGHIRSQQISRDVSRVFRACGITDGSAHRLRHTYATRLLRAGVNIRDVQRLMRHATLETTAGYTAVDEVGLLAAVELLPPLPPAA